MSAITYEQSLKRVSAYEDAVVGLSQIIGFKANKFRSHINSFYIIWLTTDLLNYLDSIEKADSIEGEGEYDYASIRQKLVKITYNFKGLYETEKTLGFAKFILNRERVIIDRLEEKLENYALAGNKETRNMVGDFIESVKNDPNIV